MYLPEQTLSSDWSRACYRVGNFSTPSKIEALWLSNDRPNDIVFDFNDEFWSKQDWSTEPSETWQELCQQRALQIRHNHKKVILWFSGGYDSLTIAWAFAEAGVHIDEFLIFEKSWFDENITQNATDLYHQFRQNFWPNLKLRILKIDHDVTENFYKDLGTDWVWNPWFRTDITKNSRLSVINSNADLMKELEQPGVTMVDGWDKPRLDIFDDTWYARLTDQGYNWHFNTPINNFYINSAFPKLHIKQTWLTMKFFEKHGVTTNQQVHQVQQIDRWAETKKPFSYQEYASAPGRVTPDFWFAREHVNKMLYAGGINNQESRALLNHYQGSDVKVFDIYRSGLEDLKSLFPNSISQSLNLQTIMGTPHKIKPVDTINSQKILINQ